MKKIALFLIFTAFLKADVVEIKNFESDLFSKNGQVLKKVEYSLLFDGRYLKENRHKIVDSLLVVISSFYIEDLFTSKGKERFKKVIKQYANKKYSLEIDDIFIQKFKIKENVTVDEFIEALKKEGYCKSKQKSNFENIDVGN
jgi:hypothetical protein